MRRVKRTGTLNLTNIKEGEIPSSYYQDYSKLPKLETIKNDIGVDIYQNDTLITSHKMIEGGALKGTVVSTIKTFSGTKDCMKELVVFGASRSVSLPLTSFNISGGLYKIQFTIDLSYSENALLIIRCLISGYSVNVPIDLDYDKWVFEDSVVDLGLRDFIKLENLMHYGDTSNIPNSSLELVSLFDEMNERGLVHLKEEWIVKNEVLKSITQTFFETGSSNKYLFGEIKSMFIAIHRELQYCLIHQAND